MCGQIQNPKIENKKETFNAVFDFYGVEMPEENRGVFLDSRIEFEKLEGVFL